MRTWPRCGSKRRTPLPPPSMACRYAACVHLRALASLLRCDECVPCVTAAGVRVLINTFLHDILVSSMRASSAALRAARLATLCCRSLPPLQVRICDAPQRACILVTNTRIRKGIACVHIPATYSHLILFHTHIRMQAKTHTDGAAKCFCDRCARPREYKHRSLADVAGRRAAE